MFFKKFEEFQEKRLYKKIMLHTMPEKTGDNYNENNELQSVKNMGEDQLDIIKEEDEWCKDLDFIGHSEKENEEAPQKVDSLKSNVEDDQLNIVEKEEASCMDLEFVDVGHWENETDVTPTQKVKNKGEFADLGQRENVTDVIPIRKVRSVKSKVKFVDVGHWKNKNNVTSTRKVRPRKSKGAFVYLGYWESEKDKVVWFQDLEFGSLGRWTNENEKPTHKFYEYAGDSDPQCTVRRDTNISQDHEVGSLLTNPKFNRKNNFNRRARKQSDEMLTCNLCNKQYVYKYSFEKHMLKHTSMKRSMYACTFCNRKFLYKRNCKKHMLIHSYDKLFKCDFCNFKCTEKSSLNSHMRRVQHNI